MIRRENLDEDRKRAMAYHALAHPAEPAEVETVEESESPMLLIHDGEVYEEPEPEDILEGLDVAGLNPADAHEERPNQR